MSRPSPMNVHAAPTSECTDTRRALLRVCSTRARGLQPSLTHGSCHRLRHDGILGVLLGAESSRSRRGLADSSSQSSILLRSLALALAADALKSFSVSSTAHARTYRSSWRRSSSPRAITNSSSLSCNSCARCLDTQSHCRHFWLQNWRGRPGPSRGGSTLRHQRHRGDSVMTEMLPSRVRRPADPRL